MIRSRFFTSVSTFSLVTALFIGAASAQSVYFDIPRGSLRTALDAYVRQSGVQLIYRVDDLKDARSSAVQGPLTPEDALAQLLKGSGFSIVSEPNGAIAIRAAAREHAANDTGLVHAIALASANSAPPQLAQATPPPTQTAQAPAVEEVVVTGSRLGEVGLTAPTPVTAVTEDQLTASGPSNVAEGLNNLPSLVPANGQRANGGSGAGARNVLNLRGLGATRTLVLLDSMRVPPTNITNTVDTNFLPQALISRVDIVTGGASASYGSDAVAGAINFVLNKRFEGLRVGLSGGLSEYGDNQELHATANFGTSFAHDRWHVIGSVDWLDNDGVAGDARDFRRAAQNLIANPAATNPPTTATPTLVRATDVRVPYTFGGVIKSATGGTAAANASIVGLQFIGNGTTAPFNFGTLTTSGNESGGDGINTAVMQAIGRPLYTRSVFGRAGFDINDDTEWFAEGYYAHSSSINAQSEFATGSNAMTIRPDNPYLAPTFAAYLNANKIASFTLGKYFRQDSEFQYYLNDSGGSWMGMTGVNGKLGAFSWAASVQAGTTGEDTTGLTDLNFTNLKLAADVTLNPANGSPVCRSTLTNPTNGCVPINVLGNGNISDAAIKYVTGTNFVFTRTKYLGGEIHINGPVFDMPAGPVAGAVGVEARRQRDAVYSNPAGVASLYQFNNTQPWNGGYDVYEGFVEMQFPLMKNASWGESLDLNLADRETHYSTSGSVNTWKAGLVYKPSDEFLLRATESRDIRAPNPSELFAAGTQGTANLNDPFNNNALIAAVRTVTRGNPLLTPEKSYTTTTGVVYQPDWANGLALTVDYYRISMKDVIATPGNQNVLNYCYQGNQTFCGFIQRNAAGTLTQVTVTQANFTSQLASGVDFEASYRVPIGDWFDWDGTLTLRGLVNYLGTLQTDVPLVGLTINAGTGSTPHWRGNLVANYESANWGAFLQGRYIGHLTWDNTYNDPTVLPYRITPYNDVKATAYLDSQITWHFNGMFDFYLNVQNVLDTKAPFDPSNSNYAVTTNANLFDQVGRMFRLGVRAKIF